MEQDTRALMHQWHVHFLFSEQKFAVNHHIPENSLLTAREGKNTTTYRIKCVEMSAFQFELLIYFIFFRFFHFAVLLQFVLILLLSASTGGNLPK